MDFGNFYFSLWGRTTRRQYWLFLVLPYFILMFVIAFIEAGAGMSDDSGYGPISLILTLVMIYPSICMTGKRWHDRDKSAWWILINFVPIIGAIWALIENGFLAGTDGPNRFGDPVDASAGSSSGPPAETPDA